MSGVSKTGTGKIDRQALLNSLRRTVFVEGGVHCKVSEAPDRVSRTPERQAFCKKVECKKVEAENVSCLDGTAHMVSLSHLGRSAGAGSPFMRAAADGRGRKLDLVARLKLFSAKWTEVDRYIEPPSPFICLNASDRQIQDTIAFFHEIETVAPAR